MALWVVAGLLIAAGLLLMGFDRKTPAALATFFLAGCAITPPCDSPMYQTATRAANRDFSKRADATLMRCAGEEYVMSVKIVRPKDGQP